MICLSRSKVNGQNSLTVVNWQAPVVALGIVLLSTAIFEIFNIFICMKSNISTPNLGFCGKTHKIVA